MMFSLISLKKTNLHSVFIDDFLATGCGEGDQFPQLEFEQLPFSHPLFIMYSSGTTGAPKCMVHSAGVRNVHTHLSQEIWGELLYDLFCLAVKNVNQGGSSVPS